MQLMVVQTPLCDTIVGKRIAATGCTVRVDLCSAMMLLREA